MSQRHNKVIGEWKERAECKGLTALFFAPEHETPLLRSRREAAARNVCALCPVALECLDYALSNNESEGIWGGLDETERNREKRRRQRIAHKTLATDPC